MTIGYNPNHAVGRPPEARAAEDHVDPEPLEEGHLGLFPIATLGKQLVNMIENLA